MGLSSLTIGADTVLKLKLGPHAGKFF